MINIIAILLCIGIVWWAYYLSTWITDKDDYIGRIFTALVLNWAFVVSILILQLWFRIEHRRKLTKDD